MCKSHGDEMRESRDGRSVTEEEVEGERDGDGVCFIKCMDTHT